MPPQHLCCGGFDYFDEKTIKNSYSFKTHPVQYKK
jgi:hypothetical protein